MHRVPNRRRRPARTFERCGAHDRSMFSERSHLLDLPARDTDRRAGFWPSACRTVTVPHRGRRRGEDASSRRKDRATLDPADVALVDAGLLGEIDLGEAAELSAFHRLNCGPLGLFEDRPVPLRFEGRPRTMGHGSLFIATSHIASSDHCGFTDSAPTRSWPCAGPSATAGAAPPRT